MEYNFLCQWVREWDISNLIFKSLLKFEDQFFIFFSHNKKKLYLQINFSSEDSFCFFVNEENLEMVDNAEVYSKKIETHLFLSSLNNISILDNDRVIVLSFSKIDIYNEKKEYNLILEIVPRNQNMILTQKKENNLFIVDCWRKISFADNRFRQILPGIEYNVPPKTFTPYSKEVTYPLSIKANKFIFDNDGKIDNINAGFCSLFYEHILENRINKLKKEKIKKYEKEKKSKLKKIENLKNKVNSDEEVKLYKNYAELLNGYFSKIKKGQSSIILTDYFNEPYNEIEIPLDPKLSPEKNISFYSKKYKKIKNRMLIFNLNIEQISEELEQLEQKIIDISLCESYFDFKTEKNNKNFKKDKNNTGLKKIRINKDWEIVVGRTSTENDKITTKIAKKDDWWFHTRIFHGAHVILRNFNKLELPQDLQIICCRLAAYFSMAKKSSNVPVDFTQKRFVRKPRGSAPGFVTYINQKTMYVDPISFREAAKWINNKFIREM